MRTAKVSVGIGRVVSASSGPIILLLLLLLL